MLLLILPVLHINIDTVCTTYLVPGINIDTACTTTATTVIFHTLGGNVKTVETLNGVSNHPFSRSKPCYTL